MSEKELLPVAEYLCPACGAWRCLPVGSEAPICACGEAHMVQTSLSALEGRKARMEERMRALRARKEAQP
jgi:hypothetical protein